MGGDEFIPWPCGELVLNIQESLQTWRMKTINMVDGANMFDEEGYLLNLSAWSEALAETLAEQEGLLLTPAHWELVHLIRRFYAEFDLSPAMRPLCKYVALHLGPDKGRSIYLLQLFPGSPAKRLAKIAGLPKPENCL